MSSFIFIFLSSYLLTSIILVFVFTNLLFIICNSSLFRLLSN
ncbi:hypothetical protein [Vibrio gallaecicus]|nr:hypothetical protein [Vibrio gallaecicus]MDN3615994.1 hypothetical protein [Vibrio gallaecicus]